MSNKDLNKKAEIAIKVSGVSKTFRIPHNKVFSVRGAFVQKISSSFKKSSPLISPFEKGGGRGDFPLLKKAIILYPPLKKGAPPPPPFLKGGHKGVFPPAMKNSKPSIMSVLK